MSRLRILLTRALATIRPRDRDNELDLELQSHIDEATEDYIARGLSPGDARRAALLSLGGVTQAEERYRDQASLQWFDQLRGDVRYGLRGLRRTPGFALIVVAVLATGIGAITSVFTLLNRVVLAPLPFEQPEQLVVMEHAAPGLGRSRVGMSSGLFFHYGQRSQSLDSIAVYSEGVEALRLPGEGAEHVRVTYGGAALFRVLRAIPELGRLFTEEDGRPGFLDATWEIPVLLSHSLWTTRFGASPDVIGRTIALGGSARKVIGVMPAGFVFPDRRTQMWVLSEPPPQTASFAQSFRYNAVARLRPGISAAGAQAELANILPQIVGAYRDATPQRLADVRLAPIVTPLRSAIVSDIAPMLWTLFAGMTFLLAIACANAASLFSIRAEHRRREIAVRQALGASRLRVARLFCSEALVLTMMAAGIGVVLANGVLRAVVSLASLELPRANEIGLDGASILFAVLIGASMAALYGALSIRRQKHALAGSLLGGGHWSTSGRRAGMRDPFVVLQVALALSLMAASALMVATYRNLTQSHLGFSPDRLLTVEMSLPGRMARRHVQIYRDVNERVRALPGVESASSASFLPLTPSEYRFPVEVGAPIVPFKFFTPGYFQTMKTPIVEGTSFAPGQTAAGDHPVLISAALARRLYPGDTAIGKTFTRLNEDWSVPSMARAPVPAYTIAGVVDDVLEVTPRAQPTEAVYVPVIEPSPEVSIVPTDMTLVIRTTADPVALTTSVRRAIADVDPSLSVGVIRTMDAIVSEARWRETFVGVLLSIAASASLFLGVVGIYGSVAHVVHQRTREIGIRVALGASRTDVIRMVSSGAIRAVLTGSALGLGIALAGTTMLTTLLFGVEPRDPLALAMVTALLLTAAIGAARVAARRAAGIAPLIAMRND